MAPSQRLSPTDFLTTLTTLLATQHSANHGSLFLTQKPLFPVTTPTSPSDTTTSYPTTEPTSPAPQIIIRATNGLPPSKRIRSASGSKVGKGVGAQKEERVKISTVVDAADIEEFFAKYAEACKAGMVGLRKRDRKKAKKGKGKKGGVGKA
jgi:signal recognition particle subunit SRP14